MKRILLPTGALLLAVTFLAPSGFGGDDAKPHLEYQRTYAAAMHEARLRGVPIYYARHKDF